MTTLFPRCVRNVNENSKSAYLHFSSVSFFVFSTPCQQLLGVRSFHTHLQTRKGIYRIRCTNLQASGIVDTAFGDRGSECTSTEPTEGLDRRNAPIATGKYGSLLEDPQARDCGIHNKQNLQTSEIPHKKLLVSHVKYNQISIKGTLFGHYTEENMKINVAYPGSGIVVFFLSKHEYINVRRTTRNGLRINLLIQRTSLIHLTNFSETGFAKRAC